jgi:hypothetical protein
VDTHGVLRSVQVVLKNVPSAAVRQFIASMRLVLKAVPVTEKAVVIIPVEVDRDPAVPVVPVALHHRGEAGEEEACEGYAGAGILYRFSFSFATLYYSGGV